MYVLTNYDVGKERSYSGLEEIIGDSDSQPQTNFQHEEF
jgi:hypothetical protein